MLACIQLLEGFKDQLEIFRRNTRAGIFNLKAQYRLSHGLGQANLESNYASIGKFYGVTEQVNEDLAQPGLIAINLGRQLVDRLVLAKIVGLKNKSNLLGFGSNPDHVNDHP